MFQKMRAHAGAVAASLGVGAALVASPTYAAPPDITGYTSAIGDVITAVTTAVPTVLVSVLAVTAGLLVVRVGIRFARSFIK